MPLIRCVNAILTPSNYEQMKHIGANMEFSEERLENLMRVYDDYITSCEYIKMPEVYKHIANAPADRFYVSDVDAAEAMHRRGRTACTQVLHHAR